MCSHNVICSNTLCKITSIVYSQLNTELLPGRSRSAYMATIQASPFQGTLVKLSVSMQSAPSVVNL